jgi:hypothetical protein
MLFYPPSEVVSDANVGYMARLPAMRTSPTEPGAEAGEGAGVQGQSPYGCPGGLRRGTSLASMTMEPSGS